MSITSGVRHAGSRRGSLTPTSTGEVGEDELVPELGVAGAEEAVVAHLGDLELGGGVALVDLVGVDEAVVEVGDAGPAHQLVVGEREHRHRRGDRGEALGRVRDVDAEVVRVQAPATPLPHHAGGHVVEDPQAAPGVVASDASGERRDAEPQQRRAPADGRGVEPPVAGAGGDGDDPVHAGVVDERDGLAAEAVADVASPASRRRVDADQAPCRGRRPCRRTTAAHRPSRTSSRRRSPCHAGRRSGCGSRWRRARSRTPRSTPPAWPSREPAGRRPRPRGRWSRSARTRSRPARGRRRR